MTEPVVELRLPLEADFDAIVALEISSYPEDEAASPESLAYRLRVASNCFRAVFVADELAGFICGTRCGSFGHESMDVHVPGAPVLAIHSVVVGDAWRRRGVALAALRSYVAHVCSTEQLESIELIAKSNLLPLYVKAGFAVKGPSSIVHGRELWFDCALDARFPVKYYVVDAFASSPYTGNPAAVVVLEEAAYGDLTAWMQRVAMEANLSETVFVRFDKNECSLRWFTPTMEVGLCGHATLAAAHSLFESGRLSGALRFQSSAGELTATLKDGTIELDFPLDVPVACSLDAESRSWLMEGLGCSSIVGLSRSKQNDLLVELESAAEIHALKPNLATLAKLDARGVVPCALGDSRGSCDFTSRFFGPRAGIDEDPVTGSAHCALAPHFAERLGGAVLSGYQASKRGGVVRCTILESTGRITIAGRACTTSRGAIGGPAA